jgi:hypothetical protein
MRPSSKMLSCVSHLQGGEDFESVVEFLRESLLSQDTDNRFASGNMLSWGQGRSQCLAEILAIFENNLKG